ncbi:MAG: flippase [Planctomycetes bacterium]|nr:flippase [Planctomycetota bacterium]
MPLPKIIQKFISKLSDINLKELLKSGFISFAFKITGILASYLLMLIITRKYGAHTSGIFALFLTFLNICAVFGRLGIETTLLRFIAEYSSQNKSGRIHDIYMKAIKIIVPACVFISILLYFLSPCIAKNLFHKTYLSAYFQIVSFIILPMVIVFINSESLRALKKIKEYAFLQDLSIPLFSVVILAIALFINRWEYMPFVAYSVSISIVFFLSVFLWLSKLNFPAIVPEEAGIKYTTLLNISLPILISNSLCLFMGWTDKILLGAFKTESDVGIYNIAFKLSTLTSIPLFAFNSIAAPKFAQFYGNGDIKSLAKLAQQVTKLIFWITTPVLVMFFVFPSFFLKIFGEEFQLGKNALIMMTAGQLVNTMTGPVAYILNMTGKQKIFRNIMFFVAIVNITLNLVFIPKYGINGTAFSNMVSVMLLNILLFVAVRYYYHFYTFSIVNVFTLKRRL